MRKKKERLLYANAAILALAALLYFALASPGAVTAMKQSTAYPIYRGSSKNSVSIQCAVTWDAAALDTILDELERSGVCITFLVGGKWAEANPDTLLKIQNRGHEIGVMGYEPERDGKAAFVRRDVQKSLDIVERVTGVRPEIYYCGSRDSAVSAWVGASLGLTTVLCTFDLDCSGADSALVVKRLASAAGAGSIINAQPTASFAAALPDIINYLKNMGYAIVPTHKMLYN